MVPQRGEGVDWAETEEAIGLQLLQMLEPPSVLVSELVLEPGPELAPVPVLALRRPLVAPPFSRHQKHPT